MSQREGVQAAPGRSFVKSEEAFDEWLSHHVDCLYRVGPCTCNYLKRREAERFAAAEKLNAVPSTCWANLVMWALGYSESPHDAFDQTVCRRDAESMGWCYCGKIRTCMKEEIE